MDQETLLQTYGREYERGQKAIVEVERLQALLGEWSSRRLLLIDGVQSTGASIKVRMDLDNLLDKTDKAAEAAKGEK